MQETRNIESTTQGQRNICSIEYSPGPPTYADNWGQVVEIRLLAARSTQVTRGSWGQFSLPAALTPDIGKDPASEIVHMESFYLIPSVTNWLSPESVSHRCLYHRDVYESRDEMRIDSQILAWGLACLAKRQDVLVPVSCYSLALCYYHQLHVYCQLSPLSPLATS